jgi:hypothetical protein
VHFGPGFSGLYIDTYKHVYLEFNAWLCGKIWLIVVRLTVVFFTLNLVLNMDAQSKFVFKIIGLNYLNLWMIYKCAFGLLNLWKY